MLSLHELLLLIGDGGEATVKNTDLLAGVNGSPSNDYWSHTFLCYLERNPSGEIDHHEEGHIVVVLAFRERIHVAAASLAQRDACNYGVKCFEHFEVCLILHELLDCLVENALNEGSMLVRQLGLMGQGVQNGSLVLQIVDSTVEELRSVNAECADELFMHFWLISGDVNVDARPSGLLEVV